MTRHNTTKPDDAEDWSLTPQQERGAQLLAMGRTVTAAAQEAGVGRQTMSGWLNHHPGFQARLNEHRVELWNSGVDRLRSMAGKALDVLEKALDGDEALTAAIHTLRACGLYGIGTPPSGPTTPAAIVAQQERSKLSLLDQLRELG